MTNEIFFSWDGGETWDVVYLPKPLAIMELFSLDAKTEQFYIFGKDDRNNPSRIHFAIDFSALHARDCGPEDYETWTPHNGVKGPTCVLGHNILYQRRKRASQCFTPDGMNKVLNVTPCQCQASDYECDADFEQSEQSGKCLYTGDDLESSAIQLQCVDDAETYYLPNGYRKVPGDKCVHELSLARKVIKDCPNYHRPLPLFRIISIALLAFVLLVIGVIIGLYFGAKDEQVRRMFPWLGFLAARYSSMEASDDDENAGNENPKGGDSDEIPPAEVEFSSTTTDSESN